MVNPPTSLSVKSLHLFREKTDYRAAGRSIDFETCGGNVTTILLVDDEPAVLDILLEEFGDDFEVLLASNAEEASFFVHGRPDIAAVVTDLELGPGRDGLDLLREISEQLPEAWRLMITGLVEDALADDVVRAGIAHLCLQKPWSFGSVARTVRDLLAEEQPRLKYATG